MVVVHDLKTVQPHFDAVSSGAKKAEVRRDDRDFAVGDVLVLCEYDPASDTYSGRKLEVRVTHILAEFEGLAPGFVAISFELCPRKIKFSEWL